MMKSTIGILSAFTLILFTVTGCGSNAPVASNRKIDLSEPLTKVAEEAKEAAKSPVLNVDPAIQITGSDLQKVNDELKKGLSSEECSRIMRSTKPNGAWAGSLHEAGGVVEYFADNGVSRLVLKYDRSVAAKDARLVTWELKTASTKQ